MQKTWTKPNRCIGEELFHMLSAAKEDFPTKAVRGSEEINSSQKDQTNG